MKRKNILLATVFTSLTLTAGSPVIANAAPEKQPAPPVKCAPIQVIGVPGSGATHSAADPEAKQEMQPGWNVAKELEDKHGADKVHGITVPYPASLGYAYSAQALKGTPEGYVGGYEGVSYGPSVKMGVEWAKNYMVQTAKECGSDTKWVLYGFSQGADVAGDIASEISSGRVDGVAPDNVISVTLISDPNRSREASVARTGTDKVTLYAPAPRGKVQENGEILPDSVQGKIGAVGARENDFSALYGKVLSLCSDADFSCSNTPGSLMTDIAKIAEQGTGFTLTESQMKSIGSIIDTFQGGDIDPAKALSAALPLLGEMKTLMPEVQKVTTAAKPVIDASKDKEGWIALFDKYGSQIEGVKKIPGASLVAKPLVQLIDSVLGLRPQGDVTEAGKASLDRLMAGINDFQTGTHVSYFKGEASPANEARNWIFEGVDNALNGKSEALSVAAITASVNDLPSPDTAPDEGTAPPEEDTPEIQTPAVDSPVVPSGPSLDKPAPSPTPAPDAVPSRLDRTPSSHVVSDSSPGVKGEAVDSPNKSTQESQRVLASTGANVLLIVGFGLAVIIAGMLVAYFNRRKK